jgi:hypothetical protein
VDIDADGLSRPDKSFDGSTGEGEARGACATEWERKEDSMAVTRLLLQ